MNNKNIFFTGIIFFTILIIFFLARFSLNSLNASAKPSIIIFKLSNELVSDIYLGHISCYDDGCRGLNLIPLFDYCYNVSVDPDIFDDTTGEISYKGSDEQREICVKMVNNEKFEGDVKKFSNGYYGMYFGPVKSNPLFIAFDKSIESNPRRGASDEMSKEKIENYVLSEDPLTELYSCDMDIIDRLRNIKENLLIEEFLENCKKII